MVVPTSSKIVQGKKMIQIVNKFNVTKLRTSFTYENKLRLIFRNNGSTLSIVTTSE